MRKEALPPTLYTVINRHRVLASLVDEPKTKPELVAELGVSRSTIDRSVRSLADCGLIDEYPLVATQYGALLYENHHAFRDRYRSIRDARPILEEASIPLDLPVDLFAGSAIVVADRVEPQKPLRQLDDLAADSVEIELLVPTAHSWYAEFAVSCGAAGIDLRITIDETSCDRFQSHFDRFQSLGGDSPVPSFDVTSRDIPIGTAVIDGDAVWICFYGDRGAEIGSLVSSSRPAIEWGRELLEEYGGCTRSTAETSRRIDLAG